MFIYLSQPLRHRARYRGMGNLTKQADSATEHRKQDSDWIAINSPNE